VEVRIDDGPWQPATLQDDDESDFTWTFWTLDWGTPTPGEHTVTSRAMAADGEVQPAPEDPFLTGKTTYWESNGGSSLLTAPSSRYLFLHLLLHFLLQLVLFFLPGFLLFFLHFRLH
jgi:hypothetical protein